MSIDERKAIIKQFYEKGLNKGDPAAFDEVLDDDFIYHSPNRPDAIGREPLKESIAQTRAAFQGYRFDIQQILVEGEMTTTRYTVSGTHTAQNEKFPFPPTGKHVTVPGCCMERWSGGKIAEKWDFVDYLSLLQQLGIIPSN